MLAGSLGSVSCGVTAPILWVLVHAKFYLCPPKLESLLPLILWKSYNQILLALEARFPWDSQSVCQIPRLGSLTWCSEPSQQLRTSLILLFSSLWVTHPASMGFDFIMIVPLLPSCCSFFFAFGCGVSFLVGSSVLLSMLFQQLVAILVLLEEEMSAHIYTLPPWALNGLFIFLSNIENRLFIWVKVLNRSVICKYFLPVCGFSFHFLKVVFQREVLTFD